MIEPMTLTPPPSAEKSLAPVSEATGSFGAVLAAVPAPPPLAAPLPQSDLVAAPAPSPDRAPASNEGAVDAAHTADEDGPAKVAEPTAAMNVTLPPVVPAFLVQLPDAAVAVRQPVSCQPAPSTLPKTVAADRRNYQAQPASIVEGETTISGQKRDDAAPAMQKPAGRPDSEAMEAPLLVALPSAPLRDGLIVLAPLAQSSVAHPSFASGAEVAFALHERHARAGASTRVLIETSELGPVSVEFAREQHGLSVAFHSEAEITRSAIADAQPRFVADAQAAGVALSHSSVGGDASRQRRRFDPAPVAKSPVPSSTSASERSSAERFA